jgi:nucleoside-diphosphate-sugar epimerase
MSQMPVRPRLSRTREREVIPMRIFVAGATGALGRTLVRRLVEGGSEVVGLTRHESRTALIGDLGAIPVVADALDRAVLSEVVLTARPDAVVHALTAIPRRGPLRPRDLSATNRLRWDGTANLLAAAIEAGARRFVAESMILIYGFGDHGDEPLTEELVPALHSSKAWLTEAEEGVRDLERQVFEATSRGELEGVILRFGFFYGVGAGTDIMARLLRRRLLPIPGDGSGIGSWIHIEDAASAAEAALGYGRPGEAYNIVDDEPVAYREFVNTLSREIGAPKPFRIPGAIGRVVAPLLMADLDSRIPVSSAKAKRELEWTPRFPTYREGLREVATRLTSIMPELGTARSGRSRSRDDHDL